MKTYDEMLYTAAEMFGPKDATANNDLGGFLGAISEMFDKRFMAVVKDYKAIAPDWNRFITPTEKSFLSQCYMDETGFMDDSLVDYSDREMKWASVSLQKKGIIWVSDETFYGDKLYDIDHEYMHYLGN